MSSPSGDRYSRADSPELITDPQLKAEREARNALKQFDIAKQIIDDFIQQPERKFRLRPSIVQQLHRAALDGISAFAGNWRPADVTIEGSEHRPGGAHLVAEQVEEMCDYVNTNWESRSPIHLAAYVLWRLNWIHPFDDGNGRTARMVSYVVLCVRLGFQLPGRYTIPEQIAENKKPYYDALEAADRALKDGGTDVSPLESLLTSMLAKQLLGIYERAKGTAAQDTAMPRLH